MCTCRPTRSTRLHFAFHILGGLPSAIVNGWFRTWSSCGSFHLVHVAWLIVFQSLWFQSLYRVVIFMRLYSEQTIAFLPVSTQYIFVFSCYMVTLRAYRGLTYYTVTLIVLFCSPRALSRSSIFRCGGGIVVRGHNIYETTVYNLLYSSGDYHTFNEACSPTKPPYRAYRPMSLPFKGRMRRGIDSCFDSQSLW